MVVAVELPSNACAKWLAHFHVHSAVAERIFQDSEAHKLGLLSIMRGQALVERCVHKM